MTNQNDPYKNIRRFLFGKDAIKEGVNREALVLATYKGDVTWSYSKSIFDDAVAYLKYQYKLDPFYTTDRETFFN
jgi:hypothetical protein